MRRKKWRRTVLLLTGALLGASMLTACQKADGKSALTEKKTVEAVELRDEAPLQWKPFLET